MAYDHNLTLAENDLFARVDHILLDRAQRFIGKHATTDRLDAVRTEIDNTLRYLKRTGVIGAVVPIYDVWVVASCLCIKRLPVNPSGLPPMLYPEQIR